MKPNRVALCYFISKATDKCFPLFKILKKEKKFQWTTGCKNTFRGLRTLLRQAFLLLKPKFGEALQLYLAVSNKALVWLLCEKKVPSSCLFITYVWHFWRLVILIWKS